MDIIKYSEENIDSLLSNLKTLVAIPSVLHNDPTNKLAPFGKENVECLEAFLQMAKEKGFDVKNIDNIVGYAELNCGIKDAETLGILCHLDVVPAPKDGWDTDPFTAVIKDGKVYGRGTADDKGPLLSAFYALCCIKEEGLKLTKNIRLIVGTDEESGSRCLERYMQVEKDPDLAFSPDADFPVIYAEKGISSFDFNYVNKDSRLISLVSGDVYNVVPDKAVLTTTINLDDYFNQFINQNKFSGLIEHDGEYHVYTLNGKRAHGANPQAGVNALVNMCVFAKDYFDNGLIKFIAEKATDVYGIGFGVDYKDYEMGPLTCNIANCKFKNNNMSIGMNIRYPIRYSYEGFISGVSSASANYDVSLKPLSNSEPHYVDKGSVLVKALYESYLKYAPDKNAKPFTIGGGTYARDFENAVAFGLQFPGEIDCMHQANEFVKIEHLKIGIQIYYEAIVRLCK